MLAVGTYCISLFLLLFALFVCLFVCLPVFLFFYRVFIQKCLKGYKCKLNLNVTD